MVAEVEDSSRQISLEEAQWDDPDFEVGDVIEIPVDFDGLRPQRRDGREAAHHPARARGRAPAHPRRVRDRVGELLSGEVQQVERGKIVIMLNKTREAEAIIPWKEQNPRERFRQGEPIRAVLKKVEETPKGPRLILSRADPLFVAALFKLEVPEIYQGIVEIKEIAREVGGRTKIAVSIARRLDRPGGRLRRASRARACRRWSASWAASASTSCPGTRTRRSSRAARSRRPRWRR